MRSVAVAFLSAEERQGIVLSTGMVAHVRGLVWFNDAVITLKRAIATASSDSVPGEEIGGGITLVDEPHKRCVLKDFNFFPNRARNRQRKNTSNVLAQALRFLKKTGSHCVVCAAQMQNYENNEGLFLWRYGLSDWVSPGVEYPCQFRLRVHALPQIAVLLRQLNEVCNTASPGFEEKRDSYQKETGREGGGLNEREPIVAHRIREAHGSIIML
jgi:hypothetical protein